MSVQPFNRLAGVNDYAPLQDFLTTILLCDDRLRQVNAVQERKFLLDATLQIDAIWMTPRNGGCGMGIVVEDVRLAKSAGSDGTVFDLVCGFVSLGERNLAFAPGAGCYLHPEQVDAIVADVAAFKYIQPFGQLQPDNVMSEPATDWINAETGIYARRSRFRILKGTRRRNTCDLVTISQNAGLVTIACSQTAAGLQIFYTEDGSCPANDAALNPRTTLYAEPFSAESGTVITAAAFAPGYSQSAVKQLIVP